MNTYLVECYWPGVDEPQVVGAVERLTDGSSEPGNGVRWVRSILIPEDEIVLGLATGRSAATVRAYAQRAGLPAERAVPCVQIRQPLVTPRKES